MTLYSVSIELGTTREIISDANGIDWRTACFVLGEHCDQNGIEMGDMDGFRGGCSYALFANGIEGSATIREVEA